VSRCVQNCCWIDVYALGDILEFIDGTTGIGRQTWPIVGSVGVTGGLVNLKVVGMVGENLRNVRCCSVGSATRVVDPPDCW